MRQWPGTVVVGWDRGAHQVPIIVVFATAQEATFGGAHSQEHPGSESRDRLLEILWLARRHLTRPSGYVVNPVSPNRPGAETPKLGNIRGSDRRQLYIQRTKDRTEYISYRPMDTLLWDSLLSLSWSTVLRAKSRNTNNQH